LLLFGIFYMAEFQIFFKTIENNVEMLYNGIKIEKRRKMG